MLWPNNTVMPHLIVSIGKRSEAFN